MVGLRSRLSRRESQAILTETILRNEGEVRRNASNAPIVHLFVGEVTRIASSLSAQGLSRNEFGGMVAQRDSNRARLRRAVFLPLDDGPETKIDGIARDRTRAADSGVGTATSRDGKSAVRPRSGRV